MIAALLVQRIVSNQGISNFPFISDLDWVGRHSPNAPIFPHIMRESSSSTVASVVVLHTLPTRNAAEALHVKGRLHGFDFFSGHSGEIVVPSMVNFSPVGVVQRTNA